MEKSLDKIAWDDLMGTECAACGRKKQARQSFCQRCYFTLPKRMRSALYTPMTNGYASIYDEAKDWLRIEGNVVYSKAN